MSKKHIKKQGEKQSTEIEQANMVADAKKNNSKVKMRFHKDMFYTDQENALYHAGEIYEIEAKMVDRWLKRGGEIVTDEMLEAESKPGLIDRILHPLSGTHKDKETKDAEADAAKAQSKEDVVTDDKTKEDVHTSKK